jgi:hypothetical protein
MRLIYLDEQEASQDGRKYTAVVGASISAKGILAVKRKFYPKLNFILKKQTDRGEVSSIIMPPPVLHGSDLLRSSYTRVRTH